jgi:hypothetical protein
MGLLDVTTSAHLLSLVLNVPEEARLTALSGANPALWSEIHAVAASPRRCRDLTAESVEEIVSWTEDPEVVRNIVANDTRHKVAQAASARLRDLQADAAPSLNQTNVLARTKRALAKTDPHTALLSLKEIAWSEVATWFRARPVHTRARVALDFAQLARTHRATQFSTELFTRSFTNEDQVETSQLWHRAGDKTAAFEAIRAWEAEMNERVAFLVAASDVAVSTISSTVASPAAVEELIKGQRFDVLGRLQSLAPLRLAELVVLAKFGPRQIAEVVQATTSPLHIDAVAPLLHGSGTECAADALTVKGISKQTRAILLRSANADRVVKTFAAEDCPDLEETIAFAKALGEGYVSSPMSILSAMTRTWADPIVATADENPGLCALIDAFYEHTNGWLRALQGSRRENWAATRCMLRVVAEFESMPEAWRVFFTAAKTHAGTMSDLVVAVKCTQQ